MKNVLNPCVEFATVATANTSVGASGAAALMILGHPGKLATSNASAPPQAEAVATPVAEAVATPKAEVVATPKADAAVQKEWDSLRNAKWTDDDGKERRGVWAEDEVEEWCRVKQQVLPCPCCRNLMVGIA